MRQHMLATPQYLQEESANIVFNLSYLYDPTVYNTFQMITNKKVVKGIFNLISLLQQSLTRSFLPKLYKLFSFDRYKG